MSAAAIEALIILGAKYGPEVVLALTGMIKKIREGKPVTIEDVEAAFANLKPYGAYGIPDKAPLPIP